MKELQLINIVLKNLYKNINFKGQFQSYLKGLNIDVDGELRFHQPTDLPVFQVQIKSTLRLHQIPDILKFSHKKEHYMVMSESISPVIKEKLREEGISYVDAAGNIFIKDQNQTIWIDGNKYKPQRKVVTNKAFTRSGLKAVFYFLLHDDSINFPYRQLAEVTGIATGNIKNIIDGLNEEGFLLTSNKKLVLQEKKRLLDRWITGYAEKLKPSLYINSYYFWRQESKELWKNLDLNKGAHLWGGEPGGALLTNYLLPEILSVYTDDHNQLMKSWTLIPSEAGVLDVYQKFWKSNDNNHQKSAPPLLIYADLLLKDDPRCHETARLIFEKYLKDEFGS